MQKEKGISLWAILLPVAILLALPLGGMAIKARKAEAVAHAQAIAQAEAEAKALAQAQAELEQSQTELEQLKHKDKELTLLFERWDQAYILADSTPRHSLTLALARMQDLRQALESFDAGTCLAAAKAPMIDYMESKEQNLIRFAMQRATTSLGSLQKFTLETGVTSARKKCFAETEAKIEDSKQRLEQLKKEST